MDGKFINKCCLVIFKKAIKPGDSELQVKRKKTVVILAIVSLAILVIVHIVDPGGNHLKGGFLISTIGIPIISVIGLVWTFYLKWDVTDRFLEAGLVLSVVYLLPSDFSCTVVSISRPWPLIVVYLDIALYLRVPKRVTLEMVSIMVSYLCVMAVESGFRFGLFDIKSTPSQQERYSSLCACAKLPCPAENAFGLAVTQLLVLVIDFTCTQGFASQVLEEKQLIVASIEASNAIATSLSRFDLILTTELLNDSQIPEGLKQAFMTLADNLKSYKPYLPQSCLPNEDSDKDETRRSDEETLAMSSASSIRGSTSVVRFHDEYRVRSATLLVANINNSLSVLDSSNRLFCYMISVLVTNAVEICSNCKGTIDMFLGDRVFANFGIGRFCVAHGPAALQASEQLSRKMKDVLENQLFDGKKKVIPSLNIGLATGSIGCCDLGCDKMLRFSLIGPLSMWVSVVERTGSLLSIPLVVDKQSSVILTEVGQTAEVRILFQSIEFKDELYVVFEVLPRDCLASGNDEWMYEMNAHASTKWKKFNHFGEAILRGKVTPPPEDESDLDEIQIALLRDLLTEGVPDPFTFKKR